MTKNTNSKAKGEMSEGVILGKLLQLGFVVLLPFGNNQRYDLVVDLGDGLFKRGQCKTARYHNGCVIFNSCNINGFTGKRKSYRGQIEVFWVYSPDMKKVYEVPVDAVPESCGYLRVETTKNGAGAKSKIKWAKDYEI